MEMHKIYLKILSISFKIKFKCRMKIQYGQGNFTQEVQSGNGLFSFNQEIQALPKLNQLQLNIIIVTQKGSQYNGGIARISIEDLQKNYGSSMKYPISKCIDRQSWIEIKVIRWQSNNVEKNNSVRQISLFQKQSFHNIPDFNISPERINKKNMVVEANLCQTKSQIGFYQPSINPFNIITNKQFNFTPSHTARKNMFNDSNNFHIKKHQKDFSPNRLSNRQSPEGNDEMKYQVEYIQQKIKKLQQKLKKQQEKYKVEYDKRKHFEVTEQNYKMQIVRLTITKEQSSKEILKKQQKIKELNVQVLKAFQVQKKNSNLREQLRKKNNQINYMSQKLILKDQQLEQIKKQAQKYIQKYEIDFNRIKKQNNLLLQQKMMTIEQLSSNIKQNNQSKDTLALKIKRLQLQLQNKEQTIATLQNKQQQSKRQADKSCNLHKKQIRLLKQQQQTMLVKERKQKQQLAMKINEQNQQSQKYKRLYNKVMKQKQLAQLINNKQQENNVIHLNQAKYKQKYDEVSAKYSKLKDQYLRVKKKSDSYAQKNVKMEEKIKKYVHQNEMINSQNIQLNEFIKLRDDKIKDSDQEWRIFKNNFQKCKLACQNQQKCIKQLQQKQKSLKHQLKKKDAQLTGINNELQNVKSRYEDLKQSKKQRNDKRNPQIDHEQELKYNMMMENQKYLQAEMLGYKSNILQLTNQVKFQKEEIEKWVKSQAQYKEFQRCWDAQRQKLSIQLGKLQKQAKQFYKRLAQQQAKTLGISEKWQKQRRNVKSHLQKINILEVTNKKIIEQKESSIQQNEILKQRLRAVQNDFIILTNQNNFSQNQRKKLISLKEQFQNQNKKLRQELSQEVMKYKYQQEHYTFQNNKSKEEINKYENKIASIKKQHQKFKENLRNILVQLVMSNLPRDQQDYSVLKRKEQKLGLTLSNQLLIKLEQYLKQIQKYKNDAQTKNKNLQKQLAQMKEQNILRTNQFQNTESQLNMKLDQLIFNLQQMKKIYGQRQEQYKRAISDLQWNQQIKTNQLYKLRQLNQNQLVDRKNMSEQFHKKQQMLSKEAQKLKNKIKEQGQRQHQFMQQIQTLEEYSNRLQQNITDLYTKQQLLINKYQIISKDYNNLQLQNESRLIQNQQLLKIKQQSKNHVSSLQNQLNQNKMIISKYKDELKQLQAMKIQLTSNIKYNIQKKENILSQFILSQQKGFILQTKQMQLENKIQELEQQKQALLKHNEELRQYKRQAIVLLKNVQLQLKQKQSEQLKMKDNMKQKQRNQSRLKQKINQFQFIVHSNQINKIKYQNSIKTQRQKYSEKERQMLLKQNQNKELLEIKLELEMKTKSKQMEIMELRGKYQELNQKYHKIIEDFNSTKNNHQIQQYRSKNQINQLLQQNTKIKQELQDRDLKNYVLSSQKYNLQTQYESKFMMMEQKHIQNGQQMLKYEEIMEEYAESIDSLSKDIQKYKNQITQKQQKIQDLEFRYRNVKSEHDQIQKSKIKAEQELQKIREQKLKLQNSKLLLQRETHNRILSLQQNVNRKEAQISRLKDEILALNRKLVISEQKILTVQLQLQHSHKKYYLQIDNVKRGEIHLKKYKDSMNQLKWVHQRQIKKYIQNRMHSVNNLSKDYSSEKITQCFRGFEEGIINIINKSDHES